MFKRLLIIQLKEHNKDKLHVADHFCQKMVCQKVKVLEYCFP